MTLHIPQKAAYSLAKELTCLAIENNYIPKHTDSSEIAKELATFFNTIVDNIDAVESESKS